MRRYHTTLKATGKRSHSDQSQGFGQGSDHIQEVPLSEDEQKAIKAQIAKGVKKEDPHLVAPSFWRSIVASGAILVFGLYGPEVDPRILWRLWIHTVAQPNLVEFVRPRKTK